MVIYWKATILCAIFRNDTSSTMHIIVKNYCIFVRKTTHVDDYLYVMKEMMEHMTIGVMDRYGHFIGKLLSYVPFLK